MIVRSILLEALYVGSRRKFYLSGSTLQSQKAPVPPQMPAILNSRLRTLKTLDLPFASDHGQTRLAGLNGCNPVTSFLVEAQCTSVSWNLELLLRCRRPFNRNFDIVHVYGLSVWEESSSGRNTYTFNRNALDSD